MWAKNGVRVWWFPRYAIPADITAEQPNPDSWGLPVGTFVSDLCDPYKFFHDNFNIFTNTFCGDWAGADGIWNYGGFAGQDKSCAAITGYSKCDDYVRNEGSKFNEAFWEVSTGVWHVLWAELMSIGVVCQVLHPPDPRLGFLSPVLISLTSTSYLGYRCFLRSVIFE
jgi:hypothetical protein